MAAIELGLAAWSALFGGFAFERGVLRVSVFDPWKPFMIGVLCASAAVWLIDRRTSVIANLHVPRRSAHALALVFLAVALGPLLAPVLSGPGFSFGHDVTGHATYTYQFDRALRQGQFPVRWVEWIEPGRGQPLFNHYQVGLYYLVAAVHVVVPSLSLSLKSTVALFWLAGAGFMFLLFKRFGLASGIVAAVTFGWSRYLMVNGYVRAAYPELVALGLAPGVLWALDSFARQGQSLYLCAFALLSAALTVCHPPTALILGPVFGAYVSHLIATRQVTLSRAVQLVPATVLAVGLAAFFVWPALGEMDAVRLGQSAAARIDYHDHFIYPEQWLRSPWWYGYSLPGPSDQLFFRLSRVQFAIMGWAVALIGGAALMRRFTTHTADVAWWLAVIAFGLFMSTHASVAVWDAFPPLGYVLFPWRYLMLPAIACAALAAVAIGMMRHQATKVVLVCCLVAGQWYLTRDYRNLTRAIPPIVMQIDDPVWSSTPNARQTAYVDWAYDPASVRETPSTASERWRIVEGHGEVQERLVKDHHLRLAATAEGPVRLAIHTPYVPGWIIRIDGEEVRTDVDQRYGYMHVEVPSGRHDVEARFTDSSTRRVANLTTMLSGIVWMGWTGVAIARKRRPS